MWWMMHLTVLIFPKFCHIENFLSIQQRQLSHIFSLIIVCASLFFFFRSTSHPCLSSEGSRVTSTATVTSRTKTTSLSTASRQDSGLSGSLLGGNSFSSCEQLAFYHWIHCSLSCFLYTWIFVFITWICFICYCHDPFSRFFTVLQAVCLLPSLQQSEILTLFFIFIIFILNYEGIENSKMP